MSNMMTFYYDFESDKSHHMEYLIWKPRIKPVFIDEPRQNSIFYTSITSIFMLSENFKAKFLLSKRGEEIALFLNSFLRLFR